MKKLSIIILVLLIFGCKSSRKHEEVYLEYSARLMKRSDDLNKEIKDVVVRSGGRPKDLQVLDDSQTLVSKRFKYLVDRSNNSLVEYADTVIQKQQKYLKEDNSLLAELIKDRNTVKNSKDTLENLFLLFKALKVEETIQLHLASTMSYHSTHDYVKTTLNPKYKFRETVYVTVTGLQEDEVEYYNFDSLLIKNNRKILPLPYKVVKSGKHVIIIFTP